MVANRRKLLYDGRCRLATRFWRSCDWSNVQMPRVLLVEDSASMRTFVRTALEFEPSLGEFSIVEAASGFDALRLLPRGPYDLVISDVNMPDINGLELVQFMRRSDLHRTTPIVLISTQSSDRDRQRGLTLGANAYLAKPFTQEALRELALEYLDKRGPKASENG